MTESSFKIAMVNDLSVVILDEDEGRSVTNDAKIVIAELQSILPNGIGKRTVYYRDTTGRFDKLLVENGDFAGFAPCSPGQQDYFNTMFKSHAIGLCQDCNRKGLWFALEDGCYYCGGKNTSKIESK